MFTSWVLQSNSTFLCSIVDRSDEHGNLMQETQGYLFDDFDTEAQEKDVKKFVSSVSDQSDDDDDDDDIQSQVRNTE